MKQRFKIKDTEHAVPDEHEIERTNARLRHFRGIAANVMAEAFEVWQQVWESCRDNRTCDEILRGIDDRSGSLPIGGWAELRERLHLLGHYIDYTRRLCEGSIDKPSHEESEV